MDVKDIAKELLKVLPCHKASLSLEHNPHKDFYETVKQWAEGRPSPLTLEDWVSSEERDRAYSLDEVWCMEWYPKNPVGYVSLMASSLEALLGGIENEKKDS